MITIATIETMNDNWSLTGSAAYGGLLELSWQVLVEVEVAQMVSDSHIFVLFLHLQNFLILIVFP